MRLPRILFATRTEASALKAVTKGIMNRTEQIVCRDWTINATLILPLQASVLKHRVIIDGTSR